MEYAKYELEYLVWVKAFLTCDKLALFNHLHIQDVINEAEEEVYHTDYDKSHVAHGFVQALPQDSLQDHEAALEW